MAETTTKRDEREKAAGRAKNDLLPGSIELVVDPIDESMEEIAAIAAAWQKNRDRNRPSPILRRALISAAQKLVDNVDFHLSREAAEAKAESG